MNKTRRAVAALALTALLATVCLLANPAMSAFTASVRNTTSTLGSGTSFLTATNGGTQCTSVQSGPIAANAVFPCTGNQFPATLPSTGSSTGDDVLTASGTAAARSTSYRIASCGPVTLLNSAATTDPMLVRGGSTLGQPGPSTLSGSASISYDGTTALATSVVSQAGPQTFSVAIWFKTTTASGALMGFSNSAGSTLPTQYDRHLYVTAGGKVAFGAYPGRIRAIESPAAYNDGAWHFAVGTLQSGLASNTARMVLYVDGVSVADTTETVPAAGGAENYNGWWRVGQSNLNTWTNASGTFFTGSLSNAAVIATAITPAQVTSLYSAGSQATYSTRVAALAPTKTWALNDTGNTFFVGNPAGFAAPCTHVLATVGTTGRCTIPVSAAACVAATAANTLAAAVTASATPVAMAIPAPGAPQTIRTTTSRAATFDVNFDTGLWLLAPIVVQQTGFDQTFTWSTNVIKI